MTNLLVIFKKNLSSWNSSYTTNSSFTNSSSRIQKSGTFIYFFKTMINLYIFCQIMVFGHFGLANISFQLFFIFYGLSAYFKFMLPLFLILYFDTKSSQFFLWTIFLSNHFFFMNIMTLVHHYHRIIFRWTITFKFYFIWLTVFRYTMESRCS